MAELKIFQVPQEVSVEMTWNIAVQGVSLRMGRAQAPQQRQHKHLSTGHAALKMEL
jgi:hypothetical protein